MTWGVRRFQLALVVGLITSGVTAAALGQGTTRPPATGGGATAAQPAGTIVAVIDIGHVFKNHPQVKQQVEAMKQDLSNYEKEIVQARQDLAKQREKMVQFSVGSAEYKQAEEQIARQVSNLQVRDQMKKKEVLDQEAKIYFDAYNEVQTQVAQLAKEYGISLVLRFDSQKIDPNDRNAVQAGVNRNVVFQRNLDLTPIVLERLAAAHPTATADRRNATTGTSTLPGATRSPTTKK